MYTKSTSIYRAERGGGWKWDRVTYTVHYADYNATGHKARPQPGVEAKDEMRWTPEARQSPEESQRAGDPARPGIGIKVQKCTCKAETVKQDYPVM